MHSLYTKNLLRKNIQHNLETGQNVTIYICMILLILTVVHTKLYIYRYILYIVNLSEQIFIS